MNRPKVFITRLIPTAGLELLETECDLDIWLGDLPPSLEEINHHVIGVNGILSLLTDPINAATMDLAGGQLRVISNYAVGYNNIDIQAATERKIAVGNTPDVLTDATADFAFALMLAAGRRIPEGQQNVRSGQWRTWGPKTFLGADFTQATLGIIGFGRIGQAMARRAAGFNMRVLFYDPTANPQSPAQKVSLEELLSNADFISLHAPLNQQTRHLIDREAFAHMKANCILVNTARGELVDSQALFEALYSHQIAAAALDVTEPEPLPADSNLLQLDNLIVTPHIASASHRTRNDMAVLAARNVLAGIHGERLPAIVNPQIYE